ncbi:OadG family protein [Desulfobotulus sp. H1]|uniref:OadG family protein n=1 Tax=Desulfobotulus pelophilus TaxID=2823377 RepID=A0ABT3N8Z6_9BACT|nr:OadG family transporter subunit [Desulfobotulus pelophilus]MCW7753923.1 OadG family protein [Desulfobotulus pelophilus]
MAEYGLSAIALHNGWEMAFLGIVIVFTGLSLLAFSISRLHRVLAFVEARKARKHAKAGELAVEKDAAPARLETPALTSFAGFQDACLHYSLLAESMGFPLSLPGLLEQAEKRGVARCHAILADFVRTGVLKPDGKGYYIWDSVAFDRIVENRELPVKQRGTMQNFFPSSPGKGRGLPGTQTGS